jgi:hypothetical protein
MKLMMMMMMRMMMMMVCVFSLARADTFRIYIILLLRGTKYVVECIEHTPTEMKTKWIASDTASATKFTKGDIALHVEPNNPAIFLYNKMGFENKYSEMRLQRRSSK